MRPHLAILGGVVLAGHKFQVFRSGIGRLKLCLAAATNAACNEEEPFPSGAAPRRHFCASSFHTCP
jgi:hypothetical protein